jgi:uncharacterized protein YodC (DUF2158 family)
MLNSGGPAMTVENVRGDIVFCIWIDNADQIRREQFPAFCLGAPRPR